MHTLLIFVCQLLISSARPLRNHKSIYISDAAVGGNWTLSEFGNYLTLSKRRQACDKQSPDRGPSCPDTTWPQPPSRAPQPRPLIPYCLGGFHYQSAGCSSKMKETFDVSLGIRYFLLRFWSNPAMARFYYFCTVPIHLIRIESFCRDQHIFSVNRFLCWTLLPITISTVFHILHNF